jgi:hypothetical protein
MCNKRKLDQAVLFKVDFKYNLIIRRLIECVNRHKQHQQVPARQVPCGCVNRHKHPGAGTSQALQVSPCPQGVQVMLARRAPEARGRQLAALASHMRYSTLWCNASLAAAQPFLTPLPSLQVAHTSSLPQAASPRE